MEGAAKGYRKALVLCARHLPGFKIAGSLDSHSQTLANGLIGYKEKVGTCELEEAILAFMDHSVGACLEESGLKYQNPFFFEKAYLKLEGIFSFLMEAKLPLEPAMETTRGMEDSLMRSVSGLVPTDPKRANELMERHVGHLGRVHAITSGESRKGEFLKAALDGVGAAVCASKGAIGEQLKLMNSISEKLGIDSAGTSLAMEIFSPQIVRVGQISAELGEIVGEEQAFAKTSTEGSGNPKEVGWASNGKIKRTAELLREVERLIAEIEARIGRGAHRDTVLTKAERHLPSIAGSAAAIGHYAQTMERAMRN